MGYKYISPIQYNFSKITDDSFDVIVSEYHAEMNKIISSHIIELNKWKDIKTLEALGLENLCKLRKLVNKAINNLKK
jgi:hypothetical protein